MIGSCLKYFSSQVLSTRLTVPDLSISSDIQSIRTHSKQSQINRRFETHFPRNESEFVSPRQPLKTSPIINKCHPSRRSEIDVQDILKQHDQQLQQISKQIEKLLQLTAEKKSKPSMCSVETMTSNVWPSTSKCDEGKKVKSKRKTRLERVQEASIESRFDETENGRFEEVENGHFKEAENCRFEEDNDEYYNHIISNIDEMLRSSDSESNESLSDPLVEERIIRRKDHHRTGVESGHQMSSETLYIKRLASKYLVSERRESPVVVKRSSTRARSQRDLQVYGISQEVSSLATKNYLQKYGLVNRPQDFTPSQQNEGFKTNHKSNPKTTNSVRTQGRGKGNNRILDLEHLKRQPKFV